MSYYLSALKNYAVFNGRTTRKEYWMFVLFNLIVTIGLGIVIGIIQFVGIKLAFLSDLYNLALMIPSIAIGIRRMHDVGKSGWFILIPIYNLVLACTASEPETNAYGPNSSEPVQ